MECWFLANYEAAYDERKRAQSVLVLVSPTVEPIEVLMAAFKGVVPDDVIAELAERLHRESLNKWVSTPPPQNADAYVAQIIEHLGRFKAELSQIASMSRGIGDNNPPNQSPIYRFSQMIKQGQNRQSRKCETNYPRESLFQPL
jgi:hypothetical protein